MIITRIPRNVKTTSVKESHTSTAATAPTWPTTLCCDIEETVVTTEAAATCCHRQDTRTSSDAINRTKAIA